MSTEVKIVTHCDVCGGPAVKTVQYRQVEPASDTDFTKPDSSLDLCSEHHGQFLLLHQHALPYLAPPADRPPLSQRGRPTAPCPECGEPITVGSGMTLHRKAQHNVAPTGRLKAVTTP